jgi:heme exporter protein A
MLTAQNLIIRRGTRTVVNGVSLTVQAGELVLVTGPNGAGKTTLLRAIAGFCPVASGTLLRAAACCFIGSIPAIKDVLTVSEHRSLWGQLSGCSGTPPFPLPAPAALGKTLSSGQKQRLHLSRLWQSNAPLWLLDEPLNALDAAAACDFETALAAHLAQGGAVIVASHQELTLPPTHRLQLHTAADATPPEDTLAAW